MKHRPAYEIVLNALKEEIPVTLGGNEYIMIDNIIGIPCTSYKDYPNDPQAIMLSSPITLNNFMSLCNQISDDDLYILSCTTALRQMAKEKVEQREKYANSKSKIT
jgi:hypothetical protein